MHDLIWKKNFEYIFVRGASRLKVMSGAFYGQMYLKKYVDIDHYIKL